MADADSIWSTERAAETSRVASIMLYGDSGVGKTFACVRMPGPVAWVAFEDGALESVWARGYRPMHVSIRSYEDALDAVHDLRRKCEVAIRKGTPLPIRSVVIDSVTSAEDKITQEIVEKGGKGLVQDSRPEVLSQGGYGVLGGRHRAVRDSVMMIPGVHKVFVALPKVKGGGEGEVVAVVPSISGQQGARFPAYCNWTFYMEAYKIKGGIGRRIHTRHTGVVYAKDRLGVLDEEERADLALVMDKGGYTSEADVYHVRNGGLGTRAESDADWAALGAE